MNYHVVVSRADEQQAYLLEDCAAGHTTWTVNGYAKTGDVVLFYMTLPVGAIIARGRVARFRYDDPESSWHNRYMCDITNLELLARPISRQTILATIPGWRYWLTPILNCHTRPEHVRALESLLKDHSAA